MGGKGIGIVILVIAGIGAAFYFLKGKVGKRSQTGMGGRIPSEDPRAGVMEEKRHTPVYKQKPAKSQKEIHMAKVKIMREKGMACHRAYSIEYAAAKNMQEAAIARNNLYACIAAVRK